MVKAIVEIVRIVYIYLVGEALASSLTHRSLTWPLEVVRCDFVDREGPAPDAELVH